MVHPKEIDFPNNLGGGNCGGCPVINEFRGLTGIHGYSIISDSDIVSQTKDIDYLETLCKGGNININKDKRCHANYESILTYGYSMDLEERDMIHVDESGGVYTAFEGKHRICALKRHDYDKLIPMRVTHVEGKRKRSPLNTLQQLAKVLCTSVSYLADGIEAELTEEEEEVLFVFNSLGSTVLKKVAIQQMKLLAGLK